MSAKNPEKSSCSEAKVAWSQTRKGNKRQAAQAIDEDEEDALFVQG